ncbi:MAG TPA: CopD family protein [Longimicrobiaceae bacterium]
MFLRRLLLLVAIVLTHALLPEVAWAHQELLGSTPASGDSLSTVPQEIRLSFSQAVEPSLAALRLIGPAGEVRLGDLSVPADSATVLTATIVGPLVPGDYTIEWLATGDDGHSVRGEIPFHLREGAAGLAVSRPTAPDATLGGNAEREPATGAQEVPAGSTFTLTPGHPLYVAVRWLNFAGIVIVIGAVVLATVVLGRMQRRDAVTPEGMIPQVRQRAAAVGFAGAVCLLIALPLRLFAQLATLEGAGGGSRGEVVASILSRSTWGRGWWLQAVAVALALVGFSLARRGRSSGWGIAALAAVALAVTPALSGHAVAASPLAVVSDTVHVLSAGGWVGTVFVMTVAALPPLLGSATTRRAAAGGLLAAFSPVALSFAAALALTGVYAAVLHLPDPSSLWASSYGRTLLIKLVALAFVFAAGFYNWRRARPVLEQRGDSRPLRRSAAIELTFGALVLAITAALVATPPPAEHAAHASVGGAPAADVSVGSPDVATP